MRRQAIPGMIKVADQIAQAPGTTNGFYQGDGTQVQQQ